MQLTPARTRVSNGIVNSISYHLFVLVSKTCVRPHVHLGSICDENQSGGHIDVFLAEWRRKRLEFKGLTETTLECPRVRDAAGLAFLYA